MKEHTLIEVRALQLLNIEKLRDSVDAIHQAAHDTAYARREANSSRRASTGRAKLPSFAIGDYVLVVMRVFTLGKSLRYDGVAPGAYYPHFLTMCSM
jgi:hypothetical protein